MPSTPQRTFKNRVHRRVVAATLASFALALGVVTFAGAPLPQTTTAASGTTAAQTTTTSSSSGTSSTPSSTSQPVSSSTSGQTSNATLTTGTS